MHRNTGTTTSSSSGSSSSGRNDGDSGGASYNPPGAEGGADVPENFDEDGGDSKAVRLTLMEEVLLLGLKDREVCRVLLFLSLFCSGFFFVIHKSSTKKAKKS